jgi:ABC-2 type transport system permease protein
MYSLPAYLEMIRMKFLMMLAYRVNYYSGILVYAINIGAYYFLWQAIYGNQSSMQGFTVAQMTTYIAVGWMARAFYFNNLDREIANEIRDGSVAIQMIRPYSYLMSKMMQGLGEGLFRILLFSTPGLILVSFLLPLDMPGEWQVWAIFLLMLAFSFVINSQINILVGLFAFFVENNAGMMSMKRILVDLCSGLIVPLTFFPSWANSILEWLPFQAITYLPASVFVGRISGNEVWQVLLTQVMWILILIVPIAYVWWRARKRLFVQGG